MNKLVIGMISSSVFFVGWVIFGYSNGFDVAIIWTPCLISFLAFLGTSGFYIRNRIWDKKQKTQNQSVVELVALDKSEATEDKENVIEEDLDKEIAILRKRKEIAELRKQVEELEGDNSRTLTPIPSNSNLGQITSEIDENRLLGQVVATRRDY